ncbi:MAG: RNase H [candidate division TA06 bacterium ADurb.Bin417]|uniref:RNase H n=1 Tax=candidate division TA06 bacterium ADurb.Bin417 TaxID=1852828 RepID=A0A1V5M754_UNCT6|nr:MAG: RNase H [candidate division TA06 bacterium ADurb.Bin417]
MVVTEEVDGTRQVAGELQAVLTALDWCRAKEIKAAAIHYDYEGIRAWATGRWKAKKAVTQNYRAAVTAAGLEITWRKVTAHTGVKWNEHADQLARQQAAAAPGPAGPAPDFMIDLDGAAADFSAFLRQQGVEAAVKIRSEAPVAHIQLALSQERESWGYLNLYGGPGKKPYPRFHELRPADRKRRVEGWWTEFKTG